MLRVSGVLLLLCIALCAFDAARSCMCLPSHPQEGICREDSFVALVRVKKETFVYEEPLRREKKSPRPESLVVRVKSNESERKQEIAEDNEKVVPFAHDYGDDELMEVHDRPTSIKYRVKLYKAYKGLSADIDKKQKLYMYTAANGAMCGMRLKTKEMYMIVGNVVDGRLTFGLCNHVIQWKSLSKGERKKVRSNMKKMESVCQSKCEVKYCPWSKCKPETKHQCVWNRSMTRMYGASLHQANFICSVRAKGRCSWNGSELSKSLHKRRRRHNAAQSSNTQQQRRVMP